MAIAVTPLGAVSANAPGGTSWTAGSSVALGTGDVVVFYNTDTGFNGDPATSITVSSISATQIGTSSSGSGSAWIAKGVATATGNIVVTAVGFIDIVGINWFLITGEDNNSGVYSATSNEGFNTPATPSITATLSGGGVGLVSMGANLLSSSPNPSTWTGCVTSGNTTVESFVASGNKQSMAGNYATASGAITVTAGGVSYSGVNSELMLVTFNVAGGGGTTAVVGSGNLAMMGVG